MGLYVCLPGSFTARIAKTDHLLAKSAIYGMGLSFRNIDSSVVNFGILIRLLKKNQSILVSVNVVSNSDWSVYIDVQAR